MPVESLFSCPDCGAVSAQRFCPTHAPAARARRVGSWTERLGMTRHEWFKTVTRIVARDKTCQLRLPGCTGVAETADHITPRSAGGSNRDDNLRGSCHHCNRSRGSRRTTSTNLADRSFHQQNDRAQPVARSHKPLVPWIG